MHLSMTAIFLLISIVIFSIFVANLANIISVDKELTDKLRNDGNIKRSTSERETLVLDDAYDRLMWFVQVSDLHISIFEDPKRISQFEEFLGSTIDAIKPKVVLASGDLTDGKDLNKLGSRQYLREWQLYQNALKDANILNKTDWLDIRGNHDYFNVPNIDSTENYFNKFSIQGGIHKRKKSYLHQVSNLGDTYSFIAVDACLEPGPKRPFNFIGLLDKKEIKNLMYLNDVARQAGGKYTIWFGHYPTSCILSYGTGNDGIRSIIGRYDDSYAYLSGHLHTQLGLVPHMYTFHKAGFLELELGDWKSNRLFRVGAFDHGLFSFVDVHYNEWPIILVTNPKDALLNMPKKEDPTIQLRSTHIRMLIFALQPVKICRVLIGASSSWKYCQKVKTNATLETNLYVVPWNPSDYPTGLQTMTIYVETSDGANRTLIHQFSLDNTSVNFPFLARFALMINACQLLQALFTVALILCVIPISIMRILHELVLSGRMKRPEMKKKRRLKKFIRKFWILSAVNRIFVPLILYCVYISVGPWAFGEVIDRHIGVIFVWGIFVNGAFQPGSLTYMYGFFQLVFCQLPLTCLYANILNRKFEERVYFLNQNSNGSKEKDSKWKKILQHWPFIAIILFEILLALLFWWAYGTLAFIIGPFRTWTIIFHCVLWLMAVKLPEKALKTSLFVWQ